MCNPHVRREYSSSCRRPVRFPCAFDSPLSMRSQSHPSGWPANESVEYRFMTHLRLSLVALTLLLATSSFSQAQDPFDEPSLPLNNSPSDKYVQKPLTFAQQTARFEAEQRVMRMQWNKWIGHDPARPSMNASYMSNGLHRYYIPQRSVIVTSMGPRVWYW